jgi:hypothetical protein
MGAGIASIVHPVRKHVGVYGEPSDLSYTHRINISSSPSTLHKSATFTVGYRLSMVGVIGTGPWPLMCGEQVILLENIQKYIAGQARRIKLSYLPGKMNDYNNARGQKHKGTVLNSTNPIKVQTTYRAIVC